MQLVWYRQYLVKYPNTWSLSWPPYLLHNRGIPIFTNKLHHIQKSAICMWKRPCLNFSLTLVKLKLYFNILVLSWVTLDLNGWCWVEQHMINIHLLSYRGGLGETAIRSSDEDSWELGKTSCFKFYVLSENHREHHGKFQWWFSKVQFDLVPSCHDECSFTKSQLELLSAVPPCLLSNTRGIIPLTPFKLHGYLESGVAALEFEWYFKLRRRYLLLISNNKYCVRHDSRIREKNFKKKQIPGVMD